MYRPTKSNNAANAERNAVLMPCENNNTNKSLHGEEFFSEIFAFLSRVTVKHSVSERSDGKVVEASVLDGCVNSEELCGTERHKLQVRARDTDYSEEQHSSTSLALSVFDLSQVGCCC